MRGEFFAFAASGIKRRLPFGSRLLLAYSLTSLNGEAVLTQTANGAYPIIWDILPLGAGRDTAVGIAYSGIIYITAGANVLFHNTYLQEYYLGNLTSFSRAS